MAGRFAALVRQSGDRDAALYSASGSRLRNRAHRSASVGIGTAGRKPGIVQMLAGQYRRVGAVAGTAMPYSGTRPAYRSFRAARAIGERGALASRPGPQERAAAFALHLRN